MSYLFAAAATVLTAIFGGPGPVADAPERLTVTVVVDEVAAGMVESIDLYLSDGTIVSQRFDAPGAVRFEVPGPGSYLVARSGLIDGAALSATCPAAPYRVDQPVMVSC